MTPPIVYVLLGVGIGMVLMLALFMVTGRRGKPRAQPPSGYVIRGGRGGRGGHGDGMSGEDGQPGEGPAGGSGGRGGAGYGA